ncbi:MAG: glycerol-3-phosphate 1-O-acyltransferase PlsY [Lachnospiraceae bacterium]|nr:glycerol-3-phosphate 1-O-acyltransferase PlsY [Lachnospiraceae bacterium]
MRLLCIVVGYAFGLVQMGYIVGKHRHIDLREHGSGNSGTTNAVRVMGLKPGVIVFLGDFLKAVVACLLMSLPAGGDPALSVIYKLYTGVGVVLGHNFPFYLQWRGGKGIASTAGVIVALGDPILALICVGAFLLITVFTRLVSLGSLLLLTFFFLGWLFVTLTGRIVLSGSFWWESVFLVLFFAAMGFWRHRTNIKRLLAGTEAKLGDKVE